LAELGADVLIDTVNGVLNGTLKPKAQDESQATFAPVLKKEHGFIDWRMPAAEIHNRVRAFNPWPSMVARFRGVTCKILKTALRTAPSPSGRGQGEGHKSDQILIPSASPLPEREGSIVSSKHSLTVV